MELEKQLTKRINIYLHWPCMSWIIFYFQVKVQKLTKLKP